MTKIELPDYCCPPTFHVYRAGRPGCDHQWKKEEDDDYVWWSCTVPGCDARAGCEVYQ